MATDAENNDNNKESQDQKNASYRRLLEDRAANNETVIVIKNGVSQLLSARKVLKELQEKEKREKDEQDGTASE